MKRYAAYKDTGISWLPSIPAHWNLEQLRKYIRLVSLKGFPDKQLLSVTREQGVIVRNTESKEENHNFIPEDLSGYKLVREGQFVINKMKSWQGSYGVSDFEGIVSPAYFVCDLNFPHKPFFSLALRSNNYVSFFAQYSKGIRVGQWDLSPIALKSIPFFEPPLAEQEKIVAFIDSKTSKIDSYVAERERELRLLNELKQAEIANVVTRGLKPDVEMKDSGIPWIGMIPKHWEVERFKYNLDLVTNKSSNASKIGLENIESFTGRFIGNFANYGGDGVEVLVGDIVYGKLRPYLCKVWLADKECNAVGDFYVYRPKKGKACNAYIKWIMLSNGFTQICNASTYGAKMPRVSSHFINSLQIPIPPLSEQQTIVDHIENKCGKVDSLITELQAEIDYLKEYKQRLIADAVTGQINVL